MRKLTLAAVAAATLIGPAVATASAATPHITTGVRVHACVRQTKHGLAVRLAQKCRKGEKSVWLRVPAASKDTLGTELGIPGPQGKPGIDGKNGKDGVNGQNGANGQQGPQGLAGLSSPWTFSYTGGHSGDTNVKGQDWANDTYSTEFMVIPQNDGSYLVEKQITGNFVTIAGASYPNDTTGNSVQTGGVTGTLTGEETFVVKMPNGAYFDPTATPDLNGMGDVEQNAAFVKAFFPNGTASNSVGYPDTYNFVYHAGSQTMVQATNAYSTTEIQG